jgi:hypothetical protein
MKKNLLLLLILFSLTDLQSQTLTLQAGTSVSSLRYENSFSTTELFRKPIVGLDISLGLDYLRLKYMHLSSHFEFIQKGGIDSITYVSPTSMHRDIIDVILNYASFNTLVCGQIPIKDRFIPFIFAGPRIDYLLSYSDPEGFLKYFANEKKLNRVLYGINAGAGMDFHINKFLTGIVFTYFFNLSMIVDYTSANGVTNQLSDRTFTINFRFGYIF